MITGGFSENIPYIPVDIKWGDAIQSHVVVLDTGFTGDIKVTHEMARDLGLEELGIGSIQTGDGKIVNLPISVAIASMPHAQLFVDVIICESLPLAGIGFLSKFGYKALVDCKNKKVNLEIV